MLRRISTRISPTSVIAMVALFVALGGISYAAAGKIGAAGLKNGAVTKQKLRKNAVVSAKIRNGAVTGAKIKNDAVTGAKVNESSLGTVPDAALLAGKAAAGFESKGFGGSGDTGFVNLPKSAVTTVATQSLPAGTYLVLARGGINNNGAKAEGEQCSLTAGDTSQTLGFGVLGASGNAGERTEFSFNLIATLPAAGDAVMSCKTNGSWEAGNITDPSIAAVSLQP